jgi:hypothetical protein
VVVGGQLRGEHAAAAAPLLHGLGVNVVKVVDSWHFLHGRLVHRWFLQSNNACVRNSHFSLWT